MKILQRATAEERYALFLPPNNPTSLVEQRVPEGTCSQVLRSTSVDS